MSTLQEDTSEHCFHLILILLQTIQYLVQLNHKQQKIFRTVEAFVQLVRCLRWEPVPRTVEERDPKK